MVRVQAGFFWPTVPDEVLLSKLSKQHTYNNQIMLHHSLGWRAKKMSLTESCKQHTNVAIFVLMCNKKENDGGCVFH